MDRYSQWVTFLKIVLPLAALVLLSTVFLISRGVDTNATIPFAKKDIEDRLRGQQITDPFFAGTTPNGDEILVMAKTLQPGSAETSAKASALDAEMRLSKGGRITMTSESGRLSPDTNMAHFEGGVTLTTADGLVIQTRALATHLDRIEVESGDDVEMTSPFGILTGGHMRIETISTDGSVQIVFNKGVKLVYDPQKSER